VAAPVSAQTTTVTAQFDIRLGPMQIGRGNFEAQIGPQTYAVGVSARVTGVASAVVGGEGTASANGALAAGRLMPEIYQISNTAGQAQNDIRLNMRGGAIARESVVPPPIPHAERIPIHDYHKRNVSDPLSAFVFPAIGSGELLSRENCNRTLRIYDGRQRYDITLTFARTEPMRVRGDYEGQVLVCRARYTPVAGHRRSPDGAAQESYTEMEASLMPVPGTRALIVYRMQVTSPSGQLVVQANRISISGGDQRQAAR